MYIHVYCLLSIVYCLLSIVYVYLLWFTKALYFWRKEVEDTPSPRNVFFLLSIDNNAHVSVCLPTTMSLCLYIYRYQCLCVCLSIYTNVCVSVCLSNQCPCVCASTDNNVNVSVCLSIPMSVCLSVYL